jgi:hypothetical protein
MYNVFYSKIMVGITHILADETKIIIAQPETINLTCRDSISNARDQPIPQFSTISASLNSLEFLSLFPN